jgi:hypothetical protein
MVAARNNMGRLEMKISVSLVLSLLGCVFLSAPPAGAIDSAKATNVITTIYEDLLGRKPDEGGLRTYRSKMVDEGWTAEQVRANLRESDEYRNRLINNAYRDLLLREADPSGLETFRRMMTEKGWTEEQIRESLRGTDEYRNAVIGTAYRDLLGRDPDPGGLEMLRSRMANEGWAEGDVRKFIRASDEYKLKEGSRKNPGRR